MGVNEDCSVRPGWTSERLQWTDFMSSAVQEAPLAADREGGKVLCVQQHPYVQVIGSLAFESLLKILQVGGGVNLTSVSRTNVLHFDATASQSDVVNSATGNNFGSNYNCSC